MSEPNMTFTRIASFARTYVAAFTRILYRCTLSVFTDPAGSMHFFQDLLNAVELRQGDRVLPSVDFKDILRCEGDVHIVGAYHTEMNSEVRNVLELSLLAHLTRTLKPKLVFEIGTYVGRTTRLLAYNGGPDCQVLTLDLPQDRCEHRVGVEFGNTPESARIRQLAGDSKTFDYSPWYGTCDFVWVDACHDYDYALQDSEAAFRLCRKGGWIAWHDFHSTGWWWGVTRALRELHARYPNIRLIRGTTIAILGPYEPAR